MSQLFAIACGGTGGHLAPGIALAEALRERGHDVALFISHKRVDERLASHYPHLRFERVPSAPFAWRPDKLLRFFWHQWRGLLFSLRFMRQQRPAAVIAFGGFTSAAVVVAARLLRVPAALHEANRVPGLAVRLLSQIAGRAFLPQGVRLPSRDGLSVCHVGLPVRREFVRLPREQARIQLGVDRNQRLLVVLGGSQGAGPLNQWIEHNLHALALAGVQIWCVTGLGKAEAHVRELGLWHGTPLRAWFEPFSDRVHVLLSAADLVLARAGAGTLAELIRCETPALLVPYPHAADNHQMANALHYEQQGGGLVVAQTSLCNLKQEVLELIYNDWLLARFAENLRRMARENASEVIVDDLERFARGETPERQQRHVPAPSSMA